MKIKYLFDAGVLSLYFAGDRRVKKYFDMVFNGEAEGYILEVNLAEFYYKTAQVMGLDAAEIRYRMLRNSEFKFITPSGDATREAAKIKFKNRNRLSLADSFLIATAKTIGAVVLTTDKNLKEVAGEMAIHIKIK